MAPQQLSIIKGGAERREAPAREHGESNREQMLIERFLALPARPRTRAASPDERLVRLGSILLNSQAVLAEALGCESCSSPMERILLFLYVQQGQGRVTSLRSLCNSPVLSPGTVALRWAAKLYGDRDLELIEAAEPGERFIRLTSDGVCRLEQWLRFIDSEFMRMRRAGGPS